jgi:hypothetical protein
VALVFESRTGSQNLNLQRGINTWILIGVQIHKFWTGADKKKRKKKKESRIRLDSLIDEQSSKSAVKDFVFSGTWERLRWFLTRLIGNDYLKLKLEQFHLEHESGLTFHWNMTWCTASWTFKSNYCNTGLTSWQQHESILKSKKKLLQILQSWNRWLVTFILQLEQVSNKKVDSSNSFV